MGRLFHQAFDLCCLATVAIGLRLELATLRLAAGDDRQVFVFRDKGPFDFEKILWVVHEFILRRSAFALMMVLIQAPEYSEIEPVGNAAAGDASIRGGWPSG